MDGIGRAIVLAEIRREEMLQQAEQYRQAKSGAGLNSARQQRAINPRTAVRALGARIDALRRRRHARNPIDLMPAASETA